MTPEGGDSKVFILLYVFWASILTFGAAGIGFVTSVSQETFVCATSSLWIASATAIFAGLVSPYLILRIGRGKYSSQTTIPLLGVWIPVTFFAGFIGGIALSSAFWATIDLTQELFALHIMDGLALLFLGALRGRQNAEMVAMGIGLLATSAGYWSLAGDEAGPFFIACICVAHIAAIFYHIGQLTRSTQRKNRMTA